MTNRIEHVTIVGGGTAGWLSAMILDRFINANRSGPRISITLIESPSVPTVGVGEATIATLPKLMELLGFDEMEFMRRCNASFKLSVKFTGWSVDEAGNPKHFYHPFNTPENVGGYNPAYHYLKFGPTTPGRSFAESMLPNLSAVASGRGPRPIGTPNYTRPMGYAYHLDAGLLAEFMRDMAQIRGIEYVRDDVEDVVINEDGKIGALKLARGGERPVEFVIDCTGFQSLILGKYLKEPFISYSNYLINDRALAVQIPHMDPTKIVSYTQASALGAGWVWRVPLYSRVGTGYVYSSAFRSEDEARDEFVAHLKAVGDLPADAPAPDLRSIKMNIGHRKRFWVGNCLAIGLSSGFVEPLEATAIYTIETAVRWLVANFPDKSCSPVLANNYNRLISILHGEIRDFIQAHYRTSNREEPYWRTVRHEVPISDLLTEKFETWKHRLPDFSDSRDGTLFKYWSYIFCLQPKGFFDGIDYPTFGSLNLEDWQAFGRKIDMQRGELLKHLPDHVQLLEHQRSGQRLLRQKVPPMAANAPLMARPGMGR